MKFYRVDWKEPDPSMLQTDWFTSSRDADRAAAEVNGSVKVVEVPMDRAGLLKFLKENIWRPA